jgi:four helix bundle protein
METVSKQTAPVLEKTYQFVLWLVPMVDKFPRSQKYLVGDRIQTAAMDVLDHLIEAAYSRDKLALLNRANLQLEKLRYLFRLAFDLRIMDMRRYEISARALDEIGRMVGGWRKANNVLQA